MSKLSLDKSRIKILLLEGIHQNAADSLASKGYGNVELLPSALTGPELVERIAETHVIGIRSRTQLTEEVLEAAQRLFCVGCFCIGTNQVDLVSAKRLGIPVFNAPYSNTRSVAELVIGEIIMLMRRIPNKSHMAHQGIWAKTAEGSHEIRGKTLGIVGYGHIGSQLSVLAEAMGMNVIFYDIADKLVIGNATSVESLDALLEEADVVSLHVPATQQTRGMMGPAELGRMKPRSLLINASRGDVVDLDSLASLVRDGHIAGAAVDVYPVEPKAKDQRLSSPLQGLENVILTPHIGGSTQEAQANIGAEVADKLARYSDNGSTVGAVNFVEVSLPVQEGVTRFLHIHRDVPGVLSKVNAVFSRRNHNIAGEYLRTDGTIGYVVVDIERRTEDDIQEVLRELKAIDGTLRARFLK